MAGRHRKRNHHSGNGKARRRRVVGLDSGAGAVLAFGLGPFSSAPVAHADGFEAIIDSIVDSLSGSTASLVDPLAGRA
jgi:hypothetical protein